MSAKLERAMKPASSLRAVSGGYSQALNGIEKQGGKRRITLARMAKRRDFVFITIVTHLKRTAFGLPRKQANLY